MTFLHSLRLLIELGLGLELGLEQMLDGCWGYLGVQEGRELRRLVKLHKHRRTAWLRAVEERIGAGTVADDFG